MQKGSISGFIDFFLGSFRWLLILVIMISSFVEYRGCFFNLTVTVISLNLIQYGSHFVYIINLTQHLQAENLTQFEKTHTDCL